uniref:Cryptochrome-1 n=1 Tax=Lygus hesperus TaxID=30085 RepID=A0A0A9YAC5_LYGHE
MGEKHLVHWFRRGLRLHDNPSLKQGLENATTFRCIFILDPWFAGSSNVGINKWRFLLQCLEDLDQSLRKLNSRLFVIRGQPADILPKLLKEWGTTCLSFEEDPEPFGRVRDQNIIALCRSMNITVHTSVAHTLYKLDAIIEKNHGKAPLTYHQFQGIISCMDPPPQPESPVTLATIGKAKSIIKDDHEEKFGVPTMEELGFDVEGLRPGVWKGGESEALSRLERHLERKAWVASFGRPKMTPQSLHASQTGLSPYLRFGCLSTRLFYYQLNDLYRKIKRAIPPLSLHGQILWREFFYCAATRNPNFDRMVGNPICVQVPWDKNPEALAKWANGQTGFPWIDAIMTQLKEEGWIHHLARHAVACFLTRGDLWLSWEEGMKVFDELLLDADWSVNAGMWMWLSCSSFFQQFFHCYCPVRFGRKADPNGDYIRKYLPVLKNMPTKYIHEPWNAPENIQKAVKCVIGVDYPIPMLNHSVVAKNNIERMKQVYHQLIKYKGPGIMASPSSNYQEKKKEDTTYDHNNIFATPSAPTLVKPTSNLR